MLGKTEGKRKMERQRMRWLISIINSMDMNLNKFREIVEKRRAWCAAVYGVPKSGTWLSNWATTTAKVLSMPFWWWKQSNKHFSFASGWEQISQLSPAIKRLAEWPTYSVSQRHWQLHFWKILYSDFISRVLSEALDSLESPFSYIGLTLQFSSSLSTSPSVTWGLLHEILFSYQ